MYVTVPKHIVEVNLGYFRCYGLEADVCRLSAHVIELRDMCKGVLVLSGLSHVWKIRICDPILQGADGNVMGIHDFCLPEWTGAEDLAVGTPSFKILAKAKAYQKQKASTSGATSSHVGKCNRVEALQLPLLKVLTPKGKGIMADDAVAASVGASRPRPSSRPAPSFRYVSGEAIYADFFPFSAGQYYATYPQESEVFKDPAIYKTMVDPFLTPGEMVQVEALPEDQLTAKMSVLHCIMMSHGGELLARYREVACLSAALNQTTVLEAEKDEEILRLKETPSERVQGELSSLAASARFERGLIMHQTKDEFADVLKKMANFILGAQDRLAKAPLLEPEKLACPTNVPTSRDARVSPPIKKELTVTPASKSLELSTNADLTPFVVASEHNEDMVNAEVDGSDPKMTDDIAAAKSGHAFVQGSFVSLKDVMELVHVGLGCASSSPNDVVVTLSCISYHGERLLAFHFM
nr:hypothetical protein [Tanacetum cinerariifolium]